MWPHRRQPTRLPHPWDSAGKNTGVGCHFLLQKDCTVHGILQAKILEWVVFPFSRESSQPRNWTQVSHVMGRFSTSWATRECVNHEKCCSNLSKRWRWSSIRKKRIMYGFKKYLGLQKYPELMDERSDILRFEQSTHCDWKPHWDCHHRRKTCLCVRDDEPHAG